MGNSTPLSNTTYDILMALDYDAEFLYETIEMYINDAQKSNKQYLVDTWIKIKTDRQNHVNMLKEILEKEIYSS